MEIDNLNDEKVIIGLLFSLWFAGYGAGITLRLFKQVIERASRP